MTVPVPPGGPDDCTRCQGFDNGRCACERIWPADYPPGQTGLDLSGAGHDRAT